VIEILQRRYQKLERMARAVPWRRTKLSTGVKVANGREPDAGFETSSPQESDVEILSSSIAAATHEAQALFRAVANFWELTQPERDPICFCDASETHRPARRDCDLPGSRRGNLF